MRRRRALLAILVLGAGSILLWRFGPGWREAAAAARSADGGFILLAAAFQCLYYLFAALLLRACLRLLDAEVPVLWSLEATFLLVMLSRVLPGPGITGPAVLYVLLQRRNVGRKEAAVAGPLFFLVDYAVYAALLAGSLVWLAFRGAATGGAAAWVVGVAAGLALVGWMALNPERVERNVTRLGRAVNRILERTRCRWRAPEGASGRAFVEETAARLRAQPWLAAVMVASGGLMALSDAASMASAFQAFGAGIGAVQSVVAYCLSTLGALVSVLPAGLGTFDAAMALAFSAPGIRDAAAAPEPAAIASGIVVYRAIATALPGAAALAASRRIMAGRRSASI
jgi:Mg2+-importing ATPase